MTASAGESIPMLKAAKQSFLSVAKHAGAFEVMKRSGFRGDRLLILAYHGVAIADEHDWNSSLYVTQEFLRRRFELLNDNGCSILPLSEAVDRLYSKTLPQQAVVITFDDGGHNFISKALPVISEFGFPVTVYLTTFYSEFNRPVFPVAVDYLLWKGRQHRTEAGSLFGMPMESDLSDPLTRASAKEHIVEYAERNSLSAAEKDSVLAELAEMLFLDYEELCTSRLMSIMDPDEIKTVSRAGVDIQLHTHRHRVPKEKHKFLREIKDNADIIHSLTGREPDHLCYPSGEYSPALYPWLREAEVVSATTCETALAGAGTEPFALPRLIDTSHLSEVEFEGWVAGISHFLPQRAATRAA